MAGRLLGVGASHRDDTRGHLGGARMGSAVSGSCFCTAQRSWGPPLCHPKPSSPSGPKSGTILPHWQPRPQHAAGQDPKIKPGGELGHVGTGVGVLGCRSGSPGRCPTSPTQTAPRTGNQLSLGIPRAPEADGAWQLGFSIWFRFYKPLRLTEMLQCLPAPMQTGLFNSNLPPRYLQPPDCSHVASPAESPTPQAAAWCHPGPS